MQTRVREPVIGMNRRSRNSNRARGARTVRQSAVRRADARIGRARRIGARHFSRANALVDQVNLRDAGPFAHRYAGVASALTRCHPTFKERSTTMKLHQTPDPTPQEPPDHPPEPAPGTDPPVPLPPDIPRPDMPPREPGYDTPIAQ